MDPERTLTLSGGTGLGDSALRPDVTTKKMWTKDRGDAFGWIRQGINPGDERISNFRDARPLPDAE